MLFYLVYLLTVFVTYRVNTVGSFVPQRKIRGVQSKIMHKDIIDSYRLKKRKELQQSLAASDVDMVSTVGERVPY